MDRRRLERIAFRIAAAATEAKLVELVATMKSLPADERTVLRQVVVPYFQEALKARASMMPLDDVPEARREVERLLRLHVAQNLAVLADAAGEP